MSSFLTLGLTLVPLAVSPSLQVKENLVSCKMLLHCKRDELRKLWIEGIEHKHVLNLLDEIETIKQVPQKLQQYTGSKHYLIATDMLVRGDPVRSRDRQLSPSCPRREISYQDRSNYLLPFLLADCFVLSACLFGALLSLTPPF